MSSNLDIISINAKKYFHKAAKLNLNVICVWIPSHSGIIGNERADDLAKKGASENTNILRYAGDQNDVRHNLQSDLKNQWIREWKSMGITKGKTYTHMRNRDKENTPIQKYFLFESKLSKYAITTMMRLRSNHCLTPEHLFRIKVVDHPNCQCGEHGNITHIFFDCQLNKENCKTLYLKLSQMQIACPINVNDVIFSQSLQVIETLIEFLKSSQLKL